MKISVSYDLKRVQKVSSVSVVVDNYKRTEFSGALEELLLDLIDQTAQQVSILYAMKREIEDLEPVASKEEGLKFSIKHYANGSPCTVTRRICSMPVTEDEAQMVLDLEKTDTKH